MRALLPARGARPDPGADLGGRRDRARAGGPGLGRDQPRAGGITHPVPGRVPAPRHHLDLAPPGRRARHLQPARPPHGGRPGRAAPRNGGAAQRPGHPDQGRPQRRPPGGGGWPGLAPTGAHVVELCLWRPGAH